MDGSAAAAPGRTARQRRYDRATVTLLLVGGLVLPFAGWLLGAALLWAGPRWSTREKLLGTLVWPLGPGGLVLLFALLPTSVTACVSGTGDPVARCTTSGWSLPAGVGATILGAVLVSGGAVGLLLARRAARAGRAAPVD